MRQCVACDWAILPLKASQAGGEILGGAGLSLTLRAFIGATSSSMAWTHRRCNPLLFQRRGACHAWSTYSNPARGRKIGAGVRHRGAGAAWAGNSRPVSASLYSDRDE
uniref:Uncharacterized protein n=1 Tax=Sphaerodactylus townsendi TaxID=933632 RepID=A0ACB8G0S1_9SAUR